MGAKWSGGVRREWLLLAFEEFFGITGVQALVLCALFERDGEAKSWRTLCVKANSHKPLSRNGLEVRICELRQALDPEAIDTVDGSYVLTEMGLAECRRAIAGMGEVLLGLGTMEAA